MADQDVKIHVSADGDLKKIEDAQKKIADLNRAAAAYESKGMDTAAKSARGDAREIERDVARMTKARAMEEKRVTQELKEQDALQKAGVGRHLITMRSLTSAGLGALATVVSALGPTVRDMWRDFVSNDAEKSIETVESVERHLKNMTSQLWFVRIDTSEVEAMEERLRRNRHRAYSVQLVPVSGKLHRSCAFRVDARQLGQAAAR